MICFTDKRSVSPSPSTPPISREQALLESFFHALSQFAFDKAKDQVVSQFILIQYTSVSYSNVLLQPVILYCLTLPSGSSWFKTHIYTVNLYTDQAFYSADAQNRDTWIKKIVQSQHFLKTKDSLQFFCKQTNKI